MGFISIIDVLKLAKDSVQKYHWFTHRKQPQKDTLLILLTWPDLVRVFLWLLPNQNVDTFSIIQHTCDASS